MIKFTLVNNYFSFFLLWFLFAFCSSCGTKKQIENNTATHYHNIVLSEIDTLNYLTILSEEQPYSGNRKFLMIDRMGKINTPKEEYISFYTDTIKYFGIFGTKKGLKGMDRNGNYLFDVFIYDNGPDYFQEGYFRVVRNGKIGYANKFGEIIIPCQFDCAWPFENGKAKVSNNCQLIKEQEHTIWQSKEWYFITKNGTKIN